MDTLAAGVRSLARFSPDGPVSQLVHRSDVQEVRLLGFEPWQTLETWPIDADVTITVLEGHGQVLVAEQVVDVSAGDLCVVPAGTAAAIRSGGGRLIVTEVVAPASTAWLPDLAGSVPAGAGDEWRVSAVPQPVTT